MGRFKARELRNDASLDEVRRQLNEVQKELAADLAVLSASRRVTELQLGDYTARYDDIVRMAPPSAGARLILPPLNLAQPNGRVTLIIESVTGNVSVEAVGTTVDGLTVRPFTIGPGTLEFRLTPSGWYSRHPTRYGEFHVDDFGAVAIQLGEDQDAAAVALRTANVKAIQAAIDAAVAVKGTVKMGPGIYLTNGLVGLVVDVDLNVGIQIQGIGDFTMIRSNNYTEAVIAFRTTGGNLREITIEGIIIRGGREGLSLAWVAYSHFNKIWFWGSKQWALQNEAGNGNFFHECRYNESAQGIGNGTEADAVLFVSCEDTLSACNFGEFSGGVLINGGVCTIDDGCLFHDCSYRGQDYHSYIDDVDVSISGTFLPLTASIILWQGSAVLKGIHGNFIHRFLMAFRAYDVLVAGCRLQTVVDAGTFIGFIDVETASGTELALHVAASTFVFLGNKSGYLINDADSVLHDASVQAQVIIYAGSSMTAIATSAPKLLNPSGENNWLQLTTFNR